MSAPSFTCPRCGAVSYNLNDIANSYCGRCHAFVDDEAGARLDAIAKKLGLRGLEEITCEPNEGARDGYGWGAWVGEFDLNCKVGTGSTPEAAIEELLDMLGEGENG